MRIAAIAAATGLTLALGAPASAATAAGDWTSDGGSQSNRYWNEHETAITADTVADLKEQFRVTTGTTALGDPLVVDGTIYLPHDDGVTAYSADGGRKLWTHHVDSVPELAWQDGALYVASGSLQTPSRLTALTSDGRARWTHTVDDIQLDTLAVGDGRVAVSGTNRDYTAKRTLAFRGNGSVAWTKEGHTLTERSTLVDGHGQVFLQPWDETSPADATLAVALDSGEVRWRADKALQPRAAVDGSVVAMEDKGVVTHRLHSLSSTDGATEWDVATSHYATARAMAADDSHAYLAERHADALTARDLSTGEVSWRAPVPEDADLTDPVVAGGLVYLTASSGSDRQLSAYRAESGEKVWTYRIDRSGFGQHPVVADGWLYLVAGDQLRAFRPT
ncbi:MAG: PQQ-binding-like beta-propeller repeat protein [Streptosporangiales bacterium]|nr:PQQ-binding-like beta-propeller repeat protein [Streptosporangiales bacterium]